MLTVHRIVNSYQHSCTYILCKENGAHVWLIDCGDYGVVKDLVISKDKRIAGVFLTHGHLDHIYGLKDLLLDIPDIPLYLSANGGIECLKTPRLNISRFTPSPLIIDSANFIELHDKNHVRLDDDLDLIAFQTEGHSPDSIIYEIDRYLFTGDAYIPHLDVVTQLPGGNKQLAPLSVEFIKQLLMEKSLTIMPGHVVDKCDLD